MSNDDTRRQPADRAQDQAMTERDAEYAERLAEHDTGSIGDTPSGTGTLKPTDDIGTGGTADIAGIREYGDTSSIRTGNIGAGDVLGTRLGDLGPTTGATGLTQAERGGLDALDALQGQSSSAPVERGPVNRSAVDRAEERVDASAGGGLNASAVGAAGLPLSDDAELPGTSDLGAAGGPDLGAGLGQTRGSAPHNPRGQISGVGGTRGSGAGTGHLEDTRSGG